MSEEITYTVEQYEEIKGKLDEFRGNNVKLMKDMDALQSKFANVDLDQYAEMMQKHRDQKDKKLIDAGKIDELVEERTARIRKDHNKVYKVLEEENSTYQRQLEGLMIDSAVRDQASKHGVLPTATEDILLRAKAVFRLKEGQAVPMDSDGNVIYLAGATEPMGVDSWVKGLTETAPHLFALSNGGGSQHGSGGGEDGSNTVTRKEFDAMTQKERSGFSKKGGKVVDNH